MNITKRKTIQTHIMMHKYEYNFQFCFVEQILHLFFIQKISLLSTRENENINHRYRYKRETAFFRYFFI